MRSGWQLSGRQAFLRLPLTQWCGVRAGGRRWRQRTMRRAVPRRVRSGGRRAPRPFLAIKVLEVNWAGPAKVEGLGEPFGAGVRLLELAMPEMPWSLNRLGRTPRGSLHFWQPLGHRQMGGI